MARWEPGAHDRLREAALTLFLERGYEQTTVTEIAQRAGVTARTYFRHFADKREVLFSGAEGVRVGMTEAMADAPPDATPITVAGLALDAAAEAIGGRWAFYRQRQVLIDANAELQERQLVKLAGLAAVLADGLRERGVSDPEARLVAESAITVLRVGFDRWVAADSPDLARTLRQVLAELLALSLDPS
jgi:AcrR family transcriptional regulator